MTDSLVSLKRCIYGHHFVRLNVHRKQRQICGGERVVEKGGKSLTRNLQKRQYDPIDAIVSLNGSKPTADRICRASASGI